MDFDYLKEVPTDDLLALEWDLRAKIRQFTLDTPPKLATRDQVVDFITLVVAHHRMRQELKTRGINLTVWLRGDNDD